MRDDTRPPTPLDEIDRGILHRLRMDGRISNTQLAREVGIAESTCLARVRSLREQGVIRGIHADLSLGRLGREVEAMVAVRFGGHHRSHFEAFRKEVAALPGVLMIFHVSGSDDFLVYVAAENSSALRDFVLDHLTTRPGVVRVETSLIFETARGEGAL